VTHAVGGEPASGTNARPGSGAHVAKLGVGCVLVFALLCFGCAPTLRFLGFLPHTGPREVTKEWRVVRIAGDRRSVVIRVVICDARFEGARVTRVGTNGQLTVFDRHLHTARAGLLDCVPFSMMPTYVVKFGFALPVGGRVLDSGCPDYVCAGPGQPAASAP
jgi:hypothetical protein